MPAQLSPQANPTDVAAALANPNMASLQGSQNTGYTTPTIPPPNTSSPIPTSTITNGSPLNLPPPAPVADGSSLVAGTMALNPPATPALGSSTPATDQATGALSGDYSQDPAYKAAQGNLDASSASLADAQGQMPSQADLLSKAQTSSGATADLAKVNELQKQLDASNASFNTMFGTAGIGIGQTTGDVVGQQGAIRNAQAIQTGVIATQLATAQGKYDTAEKLAEQTATLQFSDWQNKINNIKDFISLNQNNLSQAEKLAVSKMQAQATQQQNTLNDQKANVQLALTTGVKTPVVNMNGKFFNTANGQVYPDVPSFLKANNVSSIDEAYKKGLVTDITGQTLDNMDFVKQARAKYSDVSIPLNASPDQVTKIIQGSKIYQKQQLDNQLTQSQISKNYADAQTSKDQKTQQTLEQQYRQILVKEVSSRSGTVGTEDAKVAQSNHLASLLNQYYDPKTGNYNVPQAQYGELVLGVASLLSKTGTPSDSQTELINTATAKGDINKAIQYATGQPTNGSTQAVIKNLADSIARQARTAESNREAGLNVLRGLAPTDLSPDRAKALEQNTLVPFSGINGIADPKVQALYTPAVVSQIRTLAKAKGYGDSDLQQMVNNGYTPDQVTQLLQTP